VDNDTINNTNAEFQNKTKQNKTKQNKTKQNKTNHPKNKPGILVCCCVFIRVSRYNPVVQNSMFRFWIGQSPLSRPKPLHGCGNLQFVFFLLVLLLGVGDLVVVVVALA
jgi:hypothetical protein